MRIARCILGVFSLLLLIRVGYGQLSTEDIYVANSFLLDSPPCPNGTRIATLNNNCYPTCLSERPAKMILGGSRADIDLIDGISPNPPATEIALWGTGEGSVYTDVAEARNMSIIAPDGGYLEEFYVRTGQPLPPNRSVTAWLVWGDTQDDFGFLTDASKRVFECTISGGEVGCNDTTATGAGGHVVPACPVADNDTCRFYWMYAEADGKIDPVVGLAWSTLLTMCPPGLGSGCVVGFDDPNTL